jgi:hypothetical protein
MKQTAMMKNIGKFESSEKMMIKFCSEPLYHNTLKGNERLSFAELSVTFGIVEIPSPHYNVDSLTNNIFGVVI